VKAPVTRLMIFLLVCLLGAAVGYPGQASASQPLPDLVESKFGPAPPPAASEYQSPTGSALEVLRPFDPPLMSYGPGHLGADIAGVPGGRVLAAGAGTVIFASPVAGRGVVVIAHPDGLSTEYEPLAVAVKVGAKIARATLLGHVSGRHLGCPDAGCWHWGARRATEYVDPLSLLGALGVVRLLPLTREDAPA